MLKEATLYAVLPAKNVERLKTFFSKKLGLDPVDEQMGMPFYEVGGSRFFLYETSFAGTNQATAVCFDVTDLEAVVNDLKGKGVSFRTLRHARHDTCRRYPHHGGITCYICMV